MKGYVEPDHPVQREITATLADMTGARLDESVRGVDGCSIPTYAIPLDRLALGFARFITGEGLSPGRAAAARRLAAACMAEPWMVAGTGRFCTDGDDAASAAEVFVKTGAEGVFCAAFPETGLRRRDQMRRWRRPRLGGVDGGGDHGVRPCRRRRIPGRPVLNRRGRKVGEIRAITV